jgi:predicted component of type VI protein secretion system
MESTASVAAIETIDQDELVVHDWRVAQLVRLGIPALLAETAADHVDWHQVAKLIQRGCPPLLALRIVR